MVYAQCWTLNQKCDGMWRSFASIVSEVLCVSKNEIDEFLHDEDMDQWLRPGKHNPLAQIFLIKREEFSSYEKEVRAIVLDFGNREDTVKLKINPVDFIAKIIFAPKMSEEDFINHECKLVTFYGFDEKIITRLDLYDEY